MKKIWWIAGACLLLILITFILTNYPRHEEGREGAEYHDGSMGTDFSDQEARSGAPGYGRHPLPRPASPGDRPAMGDVRGRMQYSGGQAGNGGFTPSQSAGNDPRLQGKMPEEQDQIPDVPPDDAGADPGMNEGLTDQPPDQAQYQDGNPEEGIPQDDQPLE